MVDGSGSGYLKSVCDYVHLNPVRAKLLKTEQRLKEYRWSSWPEYLKRPAKRQPWLRVDQFLGEWGVRKDDPAGRRRLEAGLEQRAELERSQENGDWKRLRRGWYFGPKEFREELLEWIGAKHGEHHYGEELRESDEQKAERLISKALSKWHWADSDLKTRRKGDTRKVRLATQLRAETTVTWPWIAKRLAMGHWRTAVNATRSAEQKRKNIKWKILH